MYWYVCLSVLCFFKGDLKEVGRNKGWCLYYLVRYIVSIVLKIIYVDFFI